MPAILVLIASCYFPLISQCVLVVLLFDSAPHLLQISTLLRQPVHRVIRLTHGADEPSERKRLIVPGNGAAFGRHIGNGNLHRGVVIGTDDTVGGAALARDVPAKLLDCAIPSSPRHNLQVHEFSAFVLHF